MHKIIYTEKVRETSQRLLYQTIFVLGEKLSILEMGGFHFDSLVLYNSIPLSINVDFCPLVELNWNPYCPTQEFMITYIIKRQLSAMKHDSILFFFFSPF